MAIGGKRIMSKEFNGFKEEDFNVFTIDGLDERMEALSQIVRPKFEQLSNHFEPMLSVQTGDEMFTHIAKHARRTVNPPKDSWVAFANNKRGYKMMPHFQIGLWETHVFVWFAVIYESPIKEAYGEVLLNNMDKIYKETPTNFVWSKDHTKPEVLTHGDLNKEDMNQLFTRLITVKKAEILCGIQIPKEEAVTLSGKETIEKMEQAFKQLSPLYSLAHQAV